MQLAYPIQAILLYLAMLFAPADADRIVFKGPDHSGVLIRDAAGWNLAGPEGNITLKVDGTRLLSQTGDEKESLELLDYVPKMAGHDWDTLPTLSLPDGSIPDATTIEKTPDGFKLRNKRGSEGTYDYSISYVRMDPAGGSTCNVLGAVKQPGIVAIQDGDKLRSVLIKAGGPTGRATPQRVYLLSGAPGKPMSRYESFDLAALLEGRGGNPSIRDRDTLYVEPTVLLALSGDGSIAIDGAPCSSPDLDARLRDRVAAGVRSATVTAERDTPAQWLAIVLEACQKAGISSDRIELGTPAIPE